MNGRRGDIDIDFKSRDEILKLIEYIPASRIQDGELIRHNTAIYSQHIPMDPDSQLAVLDYDTAEKMGYYKIDFLNVSIYEHVRDNDHLEELIREEPNWDLLEIKEVVEQLFQIHDHFKVVDQMKPKNVDQLAMVLALIRPGKRYLIGKHWDEIEKEIWIPVAGEYIFRKSHAYAYAMCIWMQLNLLIEQLSEKVDS